MAQHDHDRRGHPTGGTGAEGHDVTRVLVVDDHPVVLAGLTAMIDATDDLEVVGSATTVEGAMGLSVDLAPDVCVLDLQLPDGDGIALGIAARKRWPRHTCAAPHHERRSRSGDAESRRRPRRLRPERRRSQRAALGHPIGRRGRRRPRSGSEPDDQRCRRRPARHRAPRRSGRPRSPRSSTCSFGAGTPARSPGSSSSPQRPSGTASRTSSASSASQLARKQSSWAASAGLDANAAP